MCPAFQAQVKIIFPLIVLKVSSRIAVPHFSLGLEADIKMEFKGKLEN